MKAKICICGHNLFTHEKTTYHTWLPIGNFPTISLSFSQCRHNECLCIKFRENERSKNEGKHI